MACEPTGPRWMQVQRLCAERGLPLVCIHVDGHQDLPSDGHEVDAAAITESNGIRWSSRRGICSEPSLGCS